MSKMIEAIIDQRRGKNDEGMSGSLFASGNKTDRIYLAASNDNGVLSAARPHARFRAVSHALLSRACHLHGRSLMAGEAKEHRHATEF